MQSEIHRKIELDELDASQNIELHVVSDSEPAVRLTTGMEQISPPAPEELDHAEQSTTAPCALVTETVDAYQHDNAAFASTHLREPLTTMISSPSSRWETIRQPFNIAYFTVATGAIGAVCHIWQMPILWLVAAVFCSFAIFALHTTWTNKFDPEDFAVNLSMRTRRLIRASALIIPIPFFAMFLFVPQANQQFQQGEKLFYQHEYKEAMVHYQNAASLNPIMEPAFRRMASGYSYLWDFDNSVTNADKALKLDPTDSVAWSAKAWALNHQSNYAEALDAALEAVKYDPRNGQGQHALADAYYNLGNYEAALPAAIKHIEIHGAEVDGYRLRAKILEQLGRTEEAAQDLATAVSLSRHHE